MYSCGLPLPESHIDVLEPRLRWEQLKVWILLLQPDVTSQSCVEYVLLVFCGFLWPRMADVSAVLVPIIKVRVLFH